MYTRYIYLAYTLCISRCIERPESVFISKESGNDFSSLSLLLATLPYPSLSHGEVEAMSFTEATEVTERGLIPEASDETLRAFSCSEMKLYKYAMPYKRQLKN
jgi:hypothetical protein